MDYGIYAPHLRTVTSHPLDTGDNQKVRIMYDIDRRRSSLATQWLVTITKTWGDSPSSARECTIMNVGSNQYLAVTNPAGNLTDSGDPVGLSASPFNWTLFPYVNDTDLYRYVLSFFFFINHMSNLKMFSCE
jgi:hypothetical protein